MDIAGYRRSPSEKRGTEKRGTMNDIDIDRFYPQRCSPRLGHASIWHGQGSLAGMVKARLLAWAYPPHEPLWHWVTRSCCGVTREFPSFILP